jgi:hypothetical protein
MTTGCNLLTDARTDSNATDGEAWEQTTNLSDEYGGYDFESEQPAFDDSEIMKLDAQEASVEVSGEDVSIADEPGAFALRILWGQLEGNRDATEPVDWSGSISVSSGAVAALRTIAFEFPNDHLLRRENRQELGFVSHTLPHFDGLLLVIKEDGDPEATLTFATGPMRETFRLSELREIDTVIPVDRAGNAVSLTGIGLDFDPACPHGGLRGRWVQRTAERGVFRGAWVTALGLPIGHVRGHFGINDEGRRVWFAKIIDRAGDVIGLARGAWEPSDDLKRPGGVFAGHWVARAGEIRGAVGGHYAATPHSDEAVAGIFSGRWRSACERTDQPGDEPVDEPPADEPPADAEPGAEPAPDQP